MAHRVAGGFLILGSSLLYVLQRKFAKGSSKNIESYFGENSGHLGPDNAQQKQSEWIFDQKVATASKDPPSGISTARATWIIAGATIVSLIVASISAGISYFQWSEIHSGSTDTHDLAQAAVQQSDTAKLTLVANQRAWIAPVLAQLTKPVGALSPAGLRIIYENTGRQPALGFTHAEQGGGILFDGKNWEALRVGENTTCQNLKPEEGTNVVYPSVHFGNSFDYDVMPSKDEAAFANQILNGSRILWINGCFAYRTFGEKHKSAFCFYLLPAPEKPMSTWTFRNCPTGNFAD
jgi:hypothetical protein